MERDGTKFTDVEPHIDYLAKDFASFRQLMLDHLSVLVPEWIEESPADIGHVLVETLAYAADYLSYYQDAVATEAYLETARLRRSVHRHARLLDYFLHEGCNARVWLQVVANQDNLQLPRGTLVLTDLAGMETVLDQAGYRDALVREPQVFETLHDLNLVAAHNAIPLYTPNPREDAILPVGATSAWLQCDYTTGLFVHKGYLPAQQGVQPESETIRTIFAQHQFKLSSALDLTPPADGETRHKLHDLETQRTFFIDQHDQLTTVYECFHVRKLQPGDVLILNEIRDPLTGRPRQDPKRRHAVRLTAVIQENRPVRQGDRTETVPVIRIEWSEADALPFPLFTMPYGKNKEPVVVAHGNIVLADHGRRIVGEALPPVQAHIRYRPALRLPGLTYRVAYEHELAIELAATEIVRQDPRQAMPEIRLLQKDEVIQLTTGKAALLKMIDQQALNRPSAQSSTQPNPQAETQTGVRYEWHLRRDLLNSDRFARDFLIEMAENEQAFVRFGFGDMGKYPETGSEFITDYRIGNGTRGNVGPDTLHHLLIAPTVTTVDDRRREGNQRTGENSAKVTEYRSAIARVWNPIAARSGVDPERIEEARLHAPYAFRHQQEQCITAADYAAMARRYPGVHRAAAQMRWVGNWHIVFIYIQRTNFARISKEFRQRLAQFMARYRQIGYELELREPDFVPLQIDLRIYLKPRQHAFSVETALLQRLGTGVNRKGVPGFFHPSNWGFGQAVYQSNVMAAAMGVPGVARVEVIKFGRGDGPLIVREIPIGPLEMATVRNDPTRPEQGTLVLKVIESNEQQSIDPDQQ